MSKLYVPKGYYPLLDPTETQRAIKRIKDHFQKELAYALNLGRVSAPLFVFPESGLNDELNGVERRVNFTIKDLDEREVEVVQSLAKWKRNALGRYKARPGRGLYTDMNAIRRDEELDNIHSIYVDQWDWEKVITRDQRNEEFLEHTVRNIYRCLLDLEEYVWDHYPDLSIEMPKKIKFIDSQELEDLYPDKTSKEREKIAAEEYGAIFVKKIGGKLYYFTTKGVMKTGWLKIRTRYYYFGSDGVQVTGWKKLSGSWYYFTSTGAMKTGWLKTGGKYYYLASNGKMKTGWVKINGKYFFFNKNGDMKTGWHHDADGNTYFLGSDGVMATGRKTINGRTYYFDSWGALVD